MISRYFKETEKSFLSNITPSQFWFQEIIGEHILKVLTAKWIESSRKLLFSWDWLFNDCAKNMKTDVRSSKLHIIAMYSIVEFIKYFFSGFQTLQEEAITATQSLQQQQQQHRKNLFLRFIRYIFTLLSKLFKGKRFLLHYWLANSWRNVKQK